MGKGRHGQSKHAYQRRVSLFFAFLFFSFLFFSFLIFPVLFRCNGLMPIRRGDANWSGAIQYVAVRMSLADVM